LAKRRYEITGVGESLMAEFSRRSEQTAERSEQLRAEFKAAHGRSATAVEDMRLHAVATIATRPDKTRHSLAELTDQWRERAAKHIEKDEQIAWVASLKDRNDLPLLGRDDLGEAILADAAGAVVTTVAEHHSTYGRQNLLAEAHRMLHGVRFASPDDRVAVAEHIAELAIARSVMLTPSPLHHTPERYVRPDGSSRLHPESRVVYTTEALLGAEARLLEAARSLEAPRVSVAVVAEVTGANLPGRDYKLSVDQALTVEKIATSGRVLDVLVGRAGTGKSTAMAGLRAVWEQSHGPGSVIGLAPSAAAAHVLGDELGIETENTAKWLTEYRRIPELAARRDRLALNLARHAYPRSPSAARLRARLAETDQAISERRLKPGQLVMIDESSLAGTFSLDELVSASTTAGSKILLLGDHGQMSSVEAGGAFSLLVKDRGDLVPELTDVRRFSSEWEKAASVELRAGNTSAIAAYEAHARVTSGDRENLLEAIYAAWKTDVEAGKSSLIIAGDTATVAELNRRARTDRVAEGIVGDSGLTLADGQRAGIGDEIVSRQNNRLLTTGKSWVKNGDHFVVAATNSDGSMAVRRGYGGAEAVLPADYVAQHLELGYATTSYRSQGRTVDTTHSLVSPTTTREVLYVAATRGRQSNMLYVDTSFDPDPATGHDGTISPQSASEVLAGVLANEGADLAAHEVLATAQRHIEDFSVLAAGYETLARAGQQQRWGDLLGRSGLEPRRLVQVRQSSAYGPLLAALRHAEAHGFDVEQTFPGLVAIRPFDDVEDPAAVLHDRVERWTQILGSSRRAGANLIAGLIPRAAGVTDPDMARGLEERDEAMQRRARALAEQAIEQGQTWVRRLGIPPTEPHARERWIEAVTTVVAYRDRWNIDDEHLPLGPKGPARSIEAIDQRSLARDALDRASRLSCASETRRPEPAAVDVGLIPTRGPSL
jgi:hypothetical protein